MIRLAVHPLTLREARAFVDLHHRHSRAPQGGLFAIQLALLDERAELERRTGPSRAVSVRAVQGAGRVSQRFIRSMQHGRERGR